MNADDFRLLYDHSCWARDRLLNAANGLSEEDYARPNGFTYDSIRGILAHILGSEAAYLGRWKGDEPRPRITQEDVLTVEALGERWRAQEAAMRDFLAQLDDAELEREIVSQRPGSPEFRRALRFDITQILLHNVQHRSEAAEALTMIGRSPGDLDFSAYQLSKVNA
jgi:uncharacterized damage-inducible protein DinB